MSQYARGDHIHATMDDTPSKRQRLSPSAEKRLRLLSQSDARRPAIRPSYLSPTKASIARFYPGLVSRAKSSEPPIGTSPKTLTNGDRRVRVEDAGGGNSGGAKIRYNSEPVGLPPGNAPGTTPESVLRQESGAVVARRSRSRTPKAHAITDDLPHSRQGKAPSVSLHNTRVVPHQENARHAVEAVASRTNDPTDAFEIRTSNTDESPPTSTRDEIITDALGKGHKKHIPTAPFFSEVRETSIFDSANRRSRRRGRHGLVPTVTDNAHSQADDLACSSYDLGAKIYLRDLPNPAPTADEEQRREIRFIITHTEMEILALERKLIRGWLLAKWNDSAGKGRPENDKIHTKLKSTAEKLIQMRLKHGPSISTQGNESLATHVCSSTQARISSDSDLSGSTSLRTRVSAFVPFNNHFTRPKACSDVLGMPTAEPLADEVRGSPISVHFTSTDLSLPNAMDARHDHVHRSTHQVEFRSTEDLLIAKIRLVIDSPAMIMVEYRLLESATYAVQEIGPFLEHVRVKSLSLTKIGTAVGRWWQVARSRAESWHTCLAKYPNLASLHLSPVNSRAAVPHGSPLMPQVPMDDHMDLDCDSIIFARGPVKLVIGWELRPDNDGDVRSRVYANPAFPSTWLTSSEVSEELLDHVEEVFHLLVKERGVLGAISVIIDIIFASG